MVSEMDITTWQIIVVEDTFDDQQLISTILEHYGIRVYVTANGDECLALLKQVRPTLIVTDLAMPNRDGWQTLLAVRADRHTAQIPVIAVTAYGSAGVAEDAEQAGFNGYFTKPIDPWTFVQSLQTILV
jgi:CheY-like chemotaxis protein